MNPTVTGGRFSSSGVGRVFAAARSHHDEEGQKARRQSSYRSLTIIAINLATERPRQQPDQFGGQPLVAVLVAGNPALDPQQSAVRTVSGARGQGT